MILFGILGQLCGWQGILGSVIVVHWLWQWYPDIFILFGILGQFVSAGWWYSVALVVWWPDIVILFGILGQFVGACWRAYWVLVHWCSSGVVVS